MRFEAFIDGTEVTDCVRSGSVTRRLNRPWQASAQLYSECAIGDACSRLRIDFIEGSNTTIWFHGLVTQISTQAGEDGAIISEYTALDPMFLWQWRPARDPDGDFSNPSFFKDLLYGPAIMQSLLETSENDTNPNFGEGPLFIDLAGASYASGVTDLSGAPVDWPMTIAECFELMASTGTLDAILTPIDVGGNMASIAVYNGDYGTDLTASVFFDYETGDHNVRTVRMTEDSTNLVNKLWYYLGPRVKTSKDPAGDQHWRANVQGQDLTLPYPPGGVSVGALNDPVGPPWTDDQLGERIYNSRISQCGVRMEIRIYDAEGDDANSPAAYGQIYQRLWQMESWLRAIPRTLVHVTPVRMSDNMQLPPGVNPVPVGAFDIGDIVTVTAGSVVRGGFTGGQRIYEYTVSWDEDGVVEVGELLTSSDQEGAL